MLISCGPTFLFLSLSLSSGIIDTFEMKGFRRDRERNLRVPELCFKTRGSIPELFTLEDGFKSKQILTGELCPQLFFLLSTKISKNRDK